MNELVAIWVGLILLNVVALLFALRAKYFGTVFGADFYGNRIEKWPILVFGIFLDFFARKPGIQLAFAVGLSCSLGGSYHFYASPELGPLFGATSQSILVASLLLVLSISIAALRSEVQQIRETSFHSIEELSNRTDVLFNLLKKMPPSVLNNVDLEKLYLDLADIKPNIVRGYEGHDAIDEIIKLLKNILEIEDKGDIDRAHIILTIAQIENYINVRSINSISQIISPHLWIKTSIKITGLVVLQFSALVFGSIQIAGLRLVADIVSISVLVLTLTVLIDILSYLAQDAREYEHRDEEDADFEN